MGSQDTYDPNRCFKCGGLGHWRYDPECPHNAPLCLPCTADPVQATAPPMVAMTSLPAPVPLQQPLLGAQTITFDLTDIHAAYNAMQTPGTDVSLEEFAPRCWHCKATGHSSKDCRNEVAALRLNGWELLPMAGSAADITDARCWHCKSTTHDVYSCRTKIARRSPGGEWVPVPQDARSPAA